MFNRFFTTSLLVIYVALAIGGHAAHRFQHLGSDGACCQNESESSLPVGATRQACLSAANATSHGCPVNPESNDGQNDDESTECLTCSVLSQVADTSASEVLPLGVAATFLKITEFPGLNLKSSRCGFMVRGPPAFLLV